MKLTAIEAFGDLHDDELHPARTPQEGGAGGDFR
jgi:hypothetical protein